MDTASIIMLFQFNDPHIMVPSAQRHDVRENLSTAYAMDMAGARVE